MAAAAASVVAVTACAGPAPARDTSGTGPTAAANPTATSAPAAPTPVADPSARFADLEDEFDARLGVYALDTGTGAEILWRDDERFAYASTIKALLAGALLDEVGVHGLDQEVGIDADDLISYSPVLQTRVGGTMTLGEVAAAAMTQSDNAAANHLFDALGGPSGLATDLADLGDEVTVVTRIEPGLNEALPGDERDTTTPRALAENLHEYTFGGTLSDEESAQLVQWLTGTETGDTLVRADLPPEWVVGDKSGTGGYGTRNDVAVVWPGGGAAPVVIAVMSSRDEEDAAHDDRLVARAAAAALAALRTG